MNVRQVYKEHHDQENSYDLYYLGKECGNGTTVTHIKYHEPQGEGDAHYCDVMFNNGEVRRIFRPDVIDFVEGEK